MDEGILAVLLIFGGGTLVLLAFSPLGRALADRLRGPGHRSAGGDDAAERAELQEALEDVRREVAELAERVDFAERLLAQRAPGALSPGPGGTPGRH
jgi:hypothetical protein